MTTLYLCRHAIAEDAAPGTKDEARALTEEGIKKMRKAARGLVDVVGKKGIGVILTSPAVRARQTGALIAEALEEAGGTALVQETRALAAGGSAAGLVEEVRAAGGGKGVGVVAVGHEPLLSEWIGELCFGHAGRVRMKKGAVAAIDLAAAGARGELVWLMQPGMLRGA